MVFSADNCKKLIQELPEALFLEDLSGNILQVNHQACRMLGYKEEELLDMEVKDLIPEGAPAFLPGQIEEATRDGKPLETINLRKDGTEVQVELRGRMIKVEGKERMLISIRDITEREQLEYDLETSEKRYRRLFETAQDGMLILDAETGKIMDANPYIQDLMGFSKEELVGKQLWEIGTFRDVVENKDKFQELVEEGYIRYEHLPLKTKSGEEALVEFVSNTYEVNGQRVVQCNIRDITEWKKAEEELEESEEKYRTIFESATDAIFIMKEDRFVDCNEETLEMFECEREDIVGKPPYEFSPEKQPDGRESVEKAKEKINLALEGNPQNFEWVHTTKDGEPFPAEVTLNRYMIEDEKFVMSIVRDITERKKAERKLRQSEERLELALEGTKAGIWDWNVQTGEVVFDERWAEIAGYTLEELQPVTIETWEELAHPEDLKKSEELLERHFNGETEVYDCEARMKHKNGDWVWVLDRGRVVEWTEEGEPERMVGTHQDITDRKRAEQALDEERNKLKELHDAVDELQRQDTEDEVVETAVEVAEKMLDFELCAIDLLEGEYLVPRANSAGLDPGETTAFKIGEGIGGKTVQRGETIWGEDVRQNPDAKPTKSEWRAFISVPIGELGIFQVISEEVGSFTERDVELAEILVGHLREELNRVRLEEELRQQAIRDPLTDLYNRRYFNETLQKEVKKADRYDKPLAFLMIDVNRFKEINDRYSHQTGDEVLKEVASLLEENFRDADTVVRYGGDEFLVMMPETNGGVTNTIDRLKEELDRWNKRSDLLDFPLTLAMGVSHWNPDQYRDVEEALNEADREMYEDKRDNS